MGRKLYEKTPEGGIRFTSHRMGQVRVANYVYDIWLPILGARGVAVYSVYCRLEREGTVKAITQADLAKACRIGSNTLRELNQQLEECGFIKITSPKTYKRLMHWTVEIEVFDPPTEVPAEIIEKYQHPRGYQALSKWLVAPEKDAEKLYGFSGKTDEYADEKLYSAPNVVSLGLHPLEVELTAAPQRESLPEPNNGDQPVDTYLPDAKTQWDILIGNRRERSWSVPPAAGGADSLGDALLDVFCEGISIPADSLPDKKSRQWAAELRKVPEQWAATQEQAMAALRALFDPGSEYAWKSYSTPYHTGFQDDWGTFLARALQGETLIKPKQKEVRYGGRSDFPD